MSIATLSFNSPVAVVGKARRQRPAEPVAPGATMLLALAVFGLGWSAVGCSGSGPGFPEDSASAEDDPASIPDAGSAAADAAPSATASFSPLCVATVDEVVGDIEVNLHADLDAAIAIKPSMATALFPNTGDDVDDSDGDGTPDFDQTWDLLPPGSYRLFVTIASLFRELNLPSATIAELRAVIPTWASGYFEELATDGVLDFPEWNEPPYPMDYYLGESLIRLVQAHALANIHHVPALGSLENDWTEIAYGGYEVALPWRCPWVATGMTPSFEIMRAVMAPDVWSAVSSPHSVVVIEGFDAVDAFFAAGETGELGPALTGPTVDALRAKLLSDDILERFLIHRVMEDGWGESKILFIRDSANQVRGFERSWVEG